MNVFSKMLLSIVLVTACNVGNFLPKTTLKPGTLVKVTDSRLADYVNKTFVIVKIDNAERFEFKKFENYLLDHAGKYTEATGFLPEYIFDYKKRCVTFYYEGEKLVVDNNNYAKIAASCSFFPDGYASTFYVITPQNNVCVKEKDGDYVLSCDDKKLALAVHPTWVNPTKIRIKPVTETDLPTDVIFAE